MKLADYIVDYITGLGTKHIFTVTGGAIVHVIDAVGRRAREKGDITYVCMQHEQAAAMAAEAYSRVSSGLGVAMATSGPGATNLITGICGCWFDSIPALFICGQVNTKESIGSITTKPRQVGFQETDIINMTKSVTKFAVQITDPRKIRYYLEKATAIARSGRPGPVLLDIPLDVQVAEINPAELIGFNHPILETVDLKYHLHKKITQSLDLIKKAKRPVILLGGGVKLANAEKDAVTFAETLGVPVIVSWSGFDILSHDHPLFFGQIGVYGHRWANFAVQNSDLLISLGSRLDTRQTGGKVDTFARDAKKIVVDIDSNEILKNRGVKIDVPICADIKDFLTPMIAALSNCKKPEINSWIKKITHWRQKYTYPLLTTNKKKFVSPHLFADQLSQRCRPGETLVVDIGGLTAWLVQSFTIKERQRFFSSFGNGPMGYALPGAIGASFALGKKSVICLTGDGGLQVNLQELQTLVHYQLPVKIFVFNNSGYGIIKQFQDQYFDSRHEASGDGYSAPDFAKIAKAYGLKAFTIKSNQEIKQKIQQVLAHTGPILCDILIDPEEKIMPKLEFGRPLEDMAPYLNRKELMREMFIDILPEPSQKSWQKI